jgi:hypothetical protein
MRRVEDTTVSAWTQVEVYATFMKLTGEVEVAGGDRLSDVVNRADRHLILRNTRSEPLSVNYPVLSRVEPRTTIAKSAVILLCPLDDECEGDGVAALRRRKIAHQAVFNSIAFSLVGDIHLDPGETLLQHIETHPLDFLPLTNVSALWVTAISSETTTVQHRFALLNPAAILSFSER